MVQCCRRFGESNIQYQLGARQQAAIPVAAFTAAGQMEKLDVALNAGLDTRLTLDEVKEILLRLYAYCGFPRSLNGSSYFISVVKSRSKRGLSDDEGRTAAPPPTNWNSVQTGNLTQTQLAGRSVGNPLFDFAPAIDVWFKTYLFGGIFQRDIPDWQDREWATVSALAILNDVNSQLESHFAICFSIGILPEQLSEFITILEQHYGVGIGESARMVLNEYPA